MSEVYKRPRIFFEDMTRFYFRNFRGEEDPMYHNTERKFGIVIDDPDYANKLKEDGWNIRTKVISEDRVVNWLPVKVGYKFPPRVYVKKEGQPGRLELHEDTIGMLDEINVVSYDCTVSGSLRKDGSGLLTAYCDELWVIQEYSRWEAKYAEEEYPEE